jgi:imidazolonepropionase-like amidohydrolase
VRSRPLAARFRTVRGRRIGWLNPGYEASFLVLGGNPMDDFSAVGVIRQRVKQGHSLGAPAS